MAERLRRLARLALALRLYQAAQPGAGMTARAHVKAARERLAALPSGSTKPLKTLSRTAKNR